MVAVSWIVRVAPLTQVDSEQQVDSPFEAMMSLLWDLGTSGIAEVDGKLLAGFDNYARAVEALAVLEQDASQPTSQGIVQFNFTLEPVTTYPQDTATATARLSWPDGAVEFSLSTAGAFGHGRHPTTVIALDLLSTSLAAHSGPEPLSLLDVGTGTGVLAIAAAKTGRASVTAVDIDPSALAVAATNIGNHGVPVALVDDSVESLVGSGQSFDLVVANVLLAEHRILARHLARLLTADSPSDQDVDRTSARPSGLLVSGYLNGQTEELIELYRSVDRRLEPVLSVYRGEWVGHVIRR